jgi:hypothetical protein
MSYDNDFICHNRLCGEEKKNIFCMFMDKRKKKVPILIKEVKLIHSDSTCVSSKSTQHIHFDAKVFPSSFILLQKLYHCRLGEFFFFEVQSAWHACTKLIWIRRSNCKKHSSSEE